MKSFEAPSKYRAMWLFALFDLPVVSTEQRRDYTRFRKRLLREGFTMMQYSVYARYVVSEDAEKAFRRRLRAVLPPDGQVRLVSITDHQFGKMDVYVGKTRAPTEEPPLQMQLF